MSVRPVFRQNPLTLPALSGRAEHAVSLPQILAQGGEVRVSNNSGERAPHSLSSRTWTVRDPRHREVNARTDGYPCQVGSVQSLYTMTAVREVIPPFPAIP